jgi:hypothetical protein
VKNQEILDDPELISDIGDYDPKTGKQKLHHVNAKGKKEGKVNKSNKINVENVSDKRS